MKHIKSGQCMMVDEKKDSGKFIVGKKDERVFSGRKFLYF
jgi:hypothetical protein